jgi:hypothetical protein
MIIDNDKFKPMFPKNNPPWKERIFRDKIQECLHNKCPKCRGTGRDENTGAICVHMISCPCPKCTPYFLGV